MSSALRSLGELMWAPFALLPPLAAVLTCAVVVGLLLLLAFRLLSPQRRLRRVKEQMSACLYEMRIYAAHPGRVLAAQGRALVLTAVYLLLASPALVVMAPPVTAMLARAATHLEYRPLIPGEVAHLTVCLSRPLHQDKLRIEAAGQGLEILPPVVLVRSVGEAHVRLRARTAGRHGVRILAGDEAVTKQILVGAGPVSTNRSASGDAAQLFSREASLDVGGLVSRIQLEYPDRELSWLGLPWYGLLLLVSLVVAFAARRRLGVVI
jgi:hypothetical protein